MKIEDKVILQLAVLKTFATFFKLTNAISNSEDKQARSYTIELFYYIYNIFNAISTMENMEAAINSFIEDPAISNGISESDLVNIITTINRYATLFLLDEMANPFLHDNVEFNTDALLIQIDLLLQYCLVSMSFFDLTFDEMYEKFKEKNNGIK